jgi:hypothetical protein
MDMAAVIRELRAELQRVEVEIRRQVRLDAAGQWAAPSVAETKPVRDSPGSEDDELVAYVAYAIWLSAPFRGISPEEALQSALRMIGRRAPKRACIRASRSNLQNTARRLLPGVRSDVAERGVFVGQVWPTFDIVIWPASMV